MAATMKYVECENQIFLAYWLMKSNAFRKKKKKKSESVKEQEPAQKPFQKQPEQPSGGSGEPCFLGWLDSLSSLRSSTTCVEALRNQLP